MSPDAHCSVVSQLLDGDLGALLSVAFKRLLASDPRGRARMEPLLGSTLALELNLPPVQVVLAFDESGCWVSGQGAGDADACVRAPLHALLPILAGEPLPEAVEIEGDTAIVQAFRDLLRELDVDWEALLADRIGDLAAHPIAVASSAISGWLTQGGASLLANLDNYLHEELALLPARPQLEHYYDEVDALRLRVDRLQARIDNLQPTVVSTDN